jgi:Flp pilus assembly protein TadD
MWLRVVLAVVLAGATALVYAPVAGFDFVALDDPLYVTENAWVLRGLDRASIEWAFTSSLGANWLPVTFLSHMLDVERAGLDAGAHHLTNLVLHISATLLLFGVLGSMTGRAVPAALVAGGFALHPLHVESVAWVTERKDVLSAVFAFATIGAWLRFARLGGARRYAGALGLLVLGLLSKAMLVTLPFVLLLLDLWPLGRISPAGGRLGAWLRTHGGAERSGRYRVLPLGRLVIEKLPLLAVVAAVGVITFHVQQQAGAMQIGESVPLSGRLLNAVHSTARYVELHLWPRGLSVQVPHPFLPDDGGRGLTAERLAWASGLVALLIFAALRRGGAVAVGIGWFLGMLVPVIGLVQVGPQGMADRYTYLPSVGLFIALVWPVSQWLERRGRWALRLGGLAGAAVLAALGVASSRQLAHWRGPVALFQRAIDVDPGNHLARYGLANLYRSLGRDDDALAQYREVLSRRPSSARAHNGMGAVLRSQGEYALAVLHLERALEEQPDLVLAYGNLGHARAALGDEEGAERAFREAIRLDPASASRRMQLAHLLRRLGRSEEAIELCRQALALQPDHVVGRRVLAWLLAERGERDEAEALLRSLLRDDPDDRRSQRQLRALQSRPPP